MKRFNATFLLLLLSTISLFAQISFEQILPPVPAPQIIPVFEAVDAADIAFADVDGNGTQDALIVGSNSNNVFTAKLFINNGGGNYTVAAGMPFDSVSNGSIAFADVNGDGSQDVLITGLNNASERIAKLYINDGSGNFTEEFGTPFDGVTESSIAFADVDGVGGIDLFITGRNSADQQIGKLYLNDGSGVFTEDAIDLGRVNKGSVAFSDVNGNGSQDLIITGLATILSIPTPIAELYINDGGGGFTKEAVSPFEFGVSSSSIAMADVDGNGAQDVLITGINGSGTTITQLYTNGGSGDFTKVAGTPFEGVREGAIAFSDINANGRKDVLITGLNSASQRVSKLFINNGSLDFTLATGTPFEAVSNSALAFSDVDGNGHDDVVISGQISASDVITKLYTNDGIGNFYEATGTPFEGVINSAIAYADVDGNGSQDVLITGRNAANEAIAKLYTNDGIGNLTEVIGTPFEGVEKGSVAFADVDGNGSQDVLITGYNIGSFQKIAQLYLNNGSGVFTLASGTPFEGVETSAIAFADVDGNGSQDVLITGFNTSIVQTAKLYINNGSGTFTEDTGTPFAGIRDGAIAFADVDGNGSQDVLISGRSGSTNQTIAKLYTNNGSGTFTEATGTPFEGVKNSSIAFADVDGVGGQDLLITGLNSSSQRIAKLYTNNGSGTFTEAAAASFTGVDNSSIAFSDLDENGSQDVFISGMSDSGEIAKLYTNDGSGIFTEVTGLPFEGVTTGAVSFLEVDGNSLNDLLITGKNSVSLPVAKFYRNTTGETFPTITSAATATVAENIVGTVYTATADEAVTFSLGSFKDEALFTLATDAISFTTAPDFETPLDGNTDNIYFLDLIATNGDGNATTQQIAITVTDLDEIAPIITSAAAASTEENTTGTIYTATADEAVTFTLGNSKDEALFTLATDAISFTSAPDFETPLDGNADNVYLVDVIATDVAGNASTLEVAISVTDINEPGPAITSGATATVAENTSGTIYTATSDETVTFTLGSSKDEALFTLATDAISFINAPDFETPLDGNTDNVYLIDLIATDGDGNATTLQIAITVTDVDDTAPSFTSAATATVEENVTGTVYTATADEAVTFTLGNSKDEALFTLATDAISFTSSPDFETPLDGNADNVYLVDVIATDGAGNASTLEVAINVTDVNEPGPAITSGATATVAENTSGIIYTATSDETVTFTLGSSKDEALFTLATDAISFTSPPDFETPLDGNTDNVYLIDLIATDGDGNATTLQVAITVTDLDEIAPTITSVATATVEENVTGTIYTATADEAVTFALGNSKDEALFTLATDLISFTSSPDFETPLDGNADNVYLVDVIATDGAGNSSTLEVAISVTDVNEPGPVFTSSGAVIVEENTTGVIYTAAVDIVATFTLGSSKDEALFSLATNEISFKSAPDFETPLDGNSDNVYLVDVVATDGDGNTTTLQLAITVIDIDEIPLAVKEESLFSIYPNPFTSKLVVEAKSGFVKDAMISITDLTGKHYKSISYNQTNLELDLSDLKAGIYIINIPAAKGIVHYKIIKE